MTRPFEGIRIIDATHVLAGPFAAYQLALLGADVIKVEHPEEPDQSRDSGGDLELSRRNMGTYFLTQGSNKRSITLDLKTEGGREVMRRLLAGADVLVENYRPGAFEALGLGYEEVSKFNPRIIYCSISAFGQGGPRGVQTAYDHVIQATSGIMATTGTPESRAGAAFSQSPQAGKLNALMKRASPRTGTDTCWLRNDPSLASGTASPSGSHRASPSSVPHRAYWPSVKIAPSMSTAESRWVVPELASAMSK